MVRGSASEDSSSLAPAPAVVQGDIRRFVVDHRARTVVVTARFGDLARSARIYQGGVLELRTADRTRVLTIDVEPGGPGQGRVEFTNRNGRPVSCDGLARRIDWSTNTVRMTVPRACLGNPRWVRAGYGYYRMNQDLVIWMDEAHRNGTVSGSLALGPRVHRG